jgi:hypothetical protein
MIAVIPNMRAFAALRKYRIVKAFVDVVIEQLDEKPRVSSSKDQETLNVQHDLYKDHAVKLIISTASCIYLH